jgi:ArsR family transcriptional regulator, arsenate/arsenite/antimonite-responsive transcriptional repressor
VSNAAGGEEFTSRSFVCCFDNCQYRCVSNQYLTPDNTSCPVEPLVREPLTARTAVTLAAKFKALSDPVRLRLLSSVASHAGGAACVCDISAGVDVSQPTISHHLKVLRDAGLLTSERRASWVYYSVVPEELMTLSSLLSVSAEIAPTAGAPA